MNNRFRKRGSDWWEQYDCVKHFKCKICGECERFSSVDEMTDKICDECGNLINVLSDFHIKHIFLDKTNRKFFTSYLEKMYRTQK